jgi:hypothetical protein
MPSRFSGSRQNALFAFQNLAKLLTSSFCFGGRKKDKIAYYGKNGGWN